MTIYDQLWFPEPLVMSLDAEPVNRQHDNLSLGINTNYNLHTFWNFAPLVVGKESAPAHFNHFNHNVCSIYKIQPEGNTAFE